MAILAATGLAERMRRYLLPLMSAFTLMANVAALPAQEMEVPAAVHIPVLVKVLSFDRQLHARASHQVVVGVVFQHGNRASLVAKDEAMKLLLAAKDAIEGVSLRATAIDLDRLTLDEVIKEGEVTHLYVTPLRATDVRALAKMAHAARITTMTGVARYMDDGLAVGVGLRGGRMRILVNLEACRMAGAEFSAEVLKLADIVP